MSAMSRTQSFLIKSVTSLYLLITHRRNLSSELSLNILVVYPRCSGFKALAPSRLSESTNIAAQKSVTFSPGYKKIETLHVSRSLFQSIIRIREKCSHGGNKDLSYSCCQWHQCQYILKKIIWQSTHQIYSWPCQVLNHILVYLRAFLKTLYMAFHLVQGKSRLI